MRQEKILDSILIKPVDFDELLAAIERSVPSCRVWIYCSKRGCL